MVNSDINGQNNRSQYHNQSYKYKSHTKRQGDSYQEITEEKLSINGEIK